jgi:hypothetical protein
LLQRGGESHHPRLVNRFFIGLFVQCSQVDHDPRRPVRKSGCLYGYPPIAPPKTRSCVTAMDAFEAVR